MLLLVFVCVGDFIFVCLFLEVLLYLFWEQSNALLLFGHGFVLIELGWFGFGSSCLIWTLGYLFSLLSLMCLFSSFTWRYHCSFYWLGFLVSLCFWGLVGAWVCALIVFGSYLLICSVPGFIVLLVLGFGVGGFLFTFLLAICVVVSAVSWLVLGTVYYSFFRCFR